MNGRLPPVTSDRLAIGVAFVAIATLACFAPAQGDTWWLLRAGQDIWTTGRVPLVETYSHTAAGAYWPNHEWLTEAAFYLLHTSGGFPMLTAACAAAATGAWLLSYGLARGSFEARFVMLLACVAPTATSFALRPQMFTLLFFSLTCTLLVRNRLRWIPVVMLAWANFHGAVALGLVAIAGATAAAVMTDRRAVMPLALTGLLSAASTLATPLGVGLWTFWLESPARSMTNDLVEWRPPDLTPVYWPFWGAAAAAVFLTIRHWRHLPPQTCRVATIAVFVLPLALQAGRNVPVFMLAALPAVTGMLAGRTTPHAVGGRRERPVLNGTLLAVTGAVSAVAVGLAWTVPPQGLNWHPFSREALAAVSRCEGPLYNTYEAGGALIWFLPDRPVFLDNRQDPYPMDLLTAARHAELSGEYEAVFTQYDIRCAVLPAASPIVAGLDSDSRWTRRYAGAEWRVFERSQR